MQHLAIANIMTCVGSCLGPAGSYTFTLWCLDPYPA